MIARSILCILATQAFLAAAVATSVEWTPEFSTAGFYPVDRNVREAINFNIGWRFHKGDANGAEAVGFDDSAWNVVNAPHGLELVPLEASGCVNYQGPAWYRKHFEVPNDWAGQKLFLHFEGVMGKSKVWVNGKMVAKNFGGYLPIHIDISDALNPGGKNVVAVWADNSDDPDYPPGKPQEQLDFTYFGGIYRDVWLVKTGRTYFTHANEEVRPKGGGIFFHVEKLSDTEAVLAVESVVRNATATDCNIKVIAVLKDRDGNTVARARQDTRIKQNGSETVSHRLVVKTPRAWQPDDPYLYDLYLGIQDGSGKSIDAMRLRAGLRTIEFRGRDGLYLNGKPFEGKLIGANRHQDFAYIGNALPNSTHWRDAKKLRDASLRIIRNAHYPQDPAFMDACDELGLFVIVNTPGWQFWNKKPIFEERVYSDIRKMVRRDRNHASVILWEPILNETHYPADFAKTVHEIVHEEYPYPGCYTACDIGARGQEHFDVVFAHPMSGNFLHDYYEPTEENYKRFMHTRENEERSVFTREWGDCVDDWNSHNSQSRVAVNWGEKAQLVQALHYGGVSSVYSSYDSLYRTTRQHVGGTLWHSFDHQRGYHPDPFWGGIMDAFRQPKYSYHLFRAQRNPELDIPHVENGPFVFVAHEMTPFSGDDIWVFSNCDEVRLSLYGKVVATKSTRELGMPHAPVVFEDIYRFFDVKGRHRRGKAQEANIKVEGMIGGKVVATTSRYPAVRRSKIVLKVDSGGAALVADGSDIVPVVAYLCDRNGRVKRLSEESIRFRVEGEGQLVDDGLIEANPQRVKWGRAVALIRASHKPGTIKVTASVLRPGKHMPLNAELELSSIAPKQRLLFAEMPLTADGRSGTSGSNASADEVESLRNQLLRTQKELSNLRLKETERQQQEFESM